MPAKVVIMDGAFGTGQHNGVTPIGELLIRAIGTLSNKISFQSFTPGSQANFYGPIAGQQFVITSMYMDGNNTNINIFEASSASSSVANKTLFTIHLLANTTLVIPLPFGGYLPVTEGEYLNATNSAGTANVNIVGYYASTEHNEA